MPDFVGPPTVLGLPPFRIDFTIAGLLSVGTGQVPVYFHRAVTGLFVIAGLGSAPTGAAAIFDVNKNGTTIFTTQGNRPTVAAGTLTDLSSTPDVTTAAAGDYITVDVDQIGSTLPGSNAVISVFYI